MSEHMHPSTMMIPSGEVDIRIRDAADGLDISGSGVELHGHKPVNSDPQ